MAKYKSLIYKAQWCRLSTGVHVVRRALADPAATQEIGLFMTPSYLLLRENIDLLSGADLVLARPAVSLHLWRLSRPLCFDIAMFLSV
ncbi:MAG: hypothetical protein ACK5PS_11600 [Desulfopila sp.]